MLIYPVCLDPDDNDTILVTFPDVPEAATFGDDEADAGNHAVGALTAMFSAYMDETASASPCPLHSKGGLA